jgi:VWFA-related protein
MEEGLRMIRPVSFSALAACLLCLIASPSAQQPSASAQQPIFRGRSDLVRVFVTVMDRDGRLVTNLAQNDFEVRDDGKAQPVTAFDNSPLPIRLIVMLDVSGSMVGNLPLLHAASEQLFGRLRPDDAARVGTFGNDVEISPTFTKDARALRDALPPSISPDAPTPLWRGIDAALDAFKGGGVRRSDSGDRDTSDGAGSRAGDRDRDKDKDKDRDRGYQAPPRTREEFEQRVKERRERGRSRDKDSDERDKDAREEAPARAEAQNGGTGNDDIRNVILVLSDGKDSGPIGFREKFVSQAEIIDRARSANVMIYAIGMRSRSGRPNTPQGIGPGALGAMLAADLPDPGLARVAEETGGGYAEIRYGEDLAAAFARVADELHSQYLLGYAPPKRDGKVHDIEVRLVTQRGLKPRARKDYVAPKN